ncbi:MAG: Kelch repeat-containing protein [Candidatus Eiseniibacteriota bacterium]
MTGPIALYDSRRDRLALFGPSVSGPSRRSLWTLSLSGSPVWQNEMLPGHHGPHPPWFAGSAAAYDPLADRIFVHAGYYFYVTEGGLVTGGLFEADLANWTARFLEHTGPEPDRRWGHGAAYDPVHNRLFIFGGGRTSGAHSELFDTWALSLGGSPRWDRIGYLQGPPQRRLAQSHLYDPLRDRLATLFGWDGVFVDCIGGSAGYYNDAWTFELSSPEHWNVVNPTTPLRPFYRSHGAMALDSSHDRIAHFGGRIDPCSARPPVVDELIAFNLGESPSWEILPQGNPRPSARGGALAFEDRLRNRMVMIGDVVDEQGQPEVWSLGYDDLRWTRHAPVGPGPAAPLEGCYDARRDRGLFLASRSTGELWALSLKEPLTWSRLDVPETIPSGTALNVVLDTARDRLVASVDRSLLGLDLTTAGGWYLIQTAGPDEPSPSNSMYDPVRDRLLFEVGPEQGSMWALSWGEPVHDVALMRVTGGRSRGRILLALVSKAPVESALWPRPFDVGSVDESSLRFNGVKPLAAGWHDPHTQKRDVDGDGLDDLVVHLDGDVLITRDRIVRLEGFTDDGARLRGELDLDAIEASPADNNATLTRAASRGLTLSRITRVAGAIDVLLTCDSPGPVHVAVFDARGRLIERQKVASSNEPRRLGLARGRTLAGGIYFVEARQGDVRAHVRVAWPGGRTVP